MSIFPPSEHYQNYLRYRQEWLKKPQPFTDSQKVDPPQYLPYAHYPTTPKQEGGGPPPPLPLAADVLIGCPGHRVDGQTGTVVDGPGIFLGTYKVRVDGTEYGFLPGELTLIESKGLSA